MAEFTVKRVVLVAAVAGALVGGAVASGVAEASSSNGGTGNTPASGGSGAVATARVVRTNLQSTVQVGGSIGFQGSYVIAAPSGTSAQQITQAEQQVNQDQQTLAADQTSESDSAAADNQAISAAQGAVNSAASQDQAQLAQAQQQLATARLNAVRDRNQAQARVQADTTQLVAAQSDLATLRVNEVNTATTYTSLPKNGDIISQDQPVYSLNGQPVPLLYGSAAAYRAYYVGMPDGPDIGQLTDDLITLGYGSGLTRSNHYSSATAAAVRRWQTAHGLSATGTILLGQVVFEPGPIRVTSVTPSVGQAVGGGGSSTVLNATSTTPVVSVALQVTQEYLVKPGDAVTVVLPDGTSTVGGHVQTVGHVAVCPNGNGGGGGNGNPNANNSADQSPCSSSGSGNSSTPTVTVTISLDSTPPGAALDQAPVNVNITTEHADNVLAVPVNALLALQGGGDAVEVVDGTAHHLVGVTTGLYSNTMVQVSGPGITAGTRVEVPSS